MANYTAVMRSALKYVSSIWSYIASSTRINTLHPHTHHIVTHGFVDRPSRSDCTDGQIYGEAGWWTTSEKIGLLTSKGHGSGWTTTGEIIQGHPPGGVGILYKKSVAGYITHIKTTNRNPYFISRVCVDVMVMSFSYAMT